LRYNNDLIAVGSGAYPMVGDPTTMLIGNRLLRIWDIKTGKLVHNLEGHMSAILGLDIDNTHVVTSSRDSLVKLWDVETGECTLFIGHEKCVYNVLLEPNYIISSSKDTTVKIWNRKESNCMHTITEHEKEVRCLSKSGEYIITGCDDDKLRIFDPVTFVNLRTIELPTFASCISSSGSNLIVNIEKSVYHYDIRTGKNVRQLKKNIYNPKFSNLREIKFDENKLLFGDRKGKVHVVDWNTGLLLSSLKLGRYRVCFDYNKDNNIIITGSSDRMIRVYDFSQESTTENMKKCIIM